jgi:hypothetical protein
MLSPNRSSSASTGLDMADSHRGRFFPRAAVVLALLCAVALVNMPFRASAKASAALPVPGAFRLQGTNGYRLYVVAEPPRKGSRGSLLIVAAVKGKQVTYHAPATVTETSMQSNLGELGEISVSFHRSGLATAIPCGKRTVRFASGTYEGRIVFHGEEGYTSVEATTVVGDAAFLVSGFCGPGFVEGSSGSRNGAELRVRNPGLGPNLTVEKSRPGAPALIFARLTEYENGISIERVTGWRIPAGDFTYDPHLRSASVHPPAPFSGSARFDLGLKAGRRWSGDLAVDMPGRADVPLTGPLLRATLTPSG